MRTRNLLNPMLTLFLVSGCVQDAQPPTATCNGVSVLDEGAEFCVHRANIIERGFRCPPERPHRYEEDEVVVCADEADTDPARIRRIIERAGFEAVVDAGAMEPDPDAAPAPEPDAAPAPEPDAAPEPEPEPEPMLPDGLPTAQDVCVSPLDVVSLAPDRAIFDFEGVFEWVIVSAPAGSVNQPVEMFFDPAQPANGGIEDDPSTPTAIFFIDAVGSYTFELRGQIRDDDGTVLYDGPIHRSNVTAGPCDGVTVEMTWDTPADDDQTDEVGTDIDLHFVIAPHEFESPLDCYFMNPNPDWGEVGLFDDDCSMDIDDTNGAGPERISLPQVLPTAPLGGPYVIGAHYYRSTAANEVGDLGPSTVTVRVWVRGELTLEASAVLESQGDWWIAAEIHRDDDGIHVVARNTVHDEVPPARP